MQTASSAIATWRDSRSASEYTATVLMPSSRQARITRTAISERLAIRIFLNKRPPSGSLGIGRAQALAHSLDERLVRRLRAQLGAALQVGESLAGTADRGVRLRAGEQDLALVGRRDLGEGQHLR